MRKGSWKWSPAGLRSPLFRAFIGLYLKDSVTLEGIELSQAAQPEGQVIPMAGVGQRVWWGSSGRTSPIPCYAERGCSGMVSLVTVILSPPTHFSQATDQGWSSFIHYQLIGTCNLVVGGALSHHASVLLISSRAQVSICPVIALPTAAQSSLTQYLNEAWLHLNFWCIFL